MSSLNKLEVDVLSLTLNKMFLAYVAICRSRIKIQLHGPKITNLFFILPAWSRTSRQGQLCVRLTFLFNWWLCGIIPRVLSGELVKKIRREVKHNRGDHYHGISVGSAHWPVERPLWPSPQQMPGETASRSYTMLQKCLYVVLILLLLQLQKTRYASKLSKMKVQKS
jgi:hypothetical protein